MTDKLVVANGKVFFAADNGAAGSELWMAPPAADYTDIYYTAAWQAIEQRKNGGANASQQTVFSPVYVNAAVLRDRDADSSTSSGNLGTTASGLEERIYFQQDANFNVTAITDTDGVVLERYLYDPYGAHTVTDDEYAPLENNASTVDNNKFFQSGDYNAATGLYIFQWRPYSVSLSRWTSIDPIGLGGGTMNFQEFVGGNPINHRDPSGLYVDVSGLAKGLAIRAPRTGPMAPLVLAAAAGAAIGGAIYDNAIGDSTIDSMVGAPGATGVVEGISLSRARIARELGPANFDELPPPLVEGINGGLAGPKGGAYVGASTLTSAQAYAKVKLLADKLELALRLNSGGKGKGPTSNGTSGCPNPCDDMINQLLSVANGKGVMGAYNKILNAAKNWQRNHILQDKAYSKYIPRDFGPSISFDFVLHKDWHKWLRKNFWSKYLPGGALFQKAPPTHADYLDALMKAITAMGCDKAVAQAVRDFADETAKIFGIKPNSPLSVPTR